ncbi:uncharacterized protein EI90DRAFT_3287565 [Cantharellus anzutake]|uniref:uncharacterized protein n=1 Tax=Cantharellus anzutake TaxID=1750568 RepID=UPI0019042CEB|nr:uncharacterized protein EI90DRAFT_3287565 [Cantharellus anzutake]KAF8336537.1 hypothetical protein EI90DRAFT_3287565 [Cantharellus anzutake]
MTLLYPHMLMRCLLGRRLLWIHSELPPPSQPLSFTERGRNVTKNKEAGSSSVGPGTSHTSYKFTAESPSHDEGMASNSSRIDGDAQPLEDYRPPEPVFETTYNTDWFEGSPTWGQSGLDVPVVQVGREHWLTEPPPDWWDAKHAAFTEYRPGPGQLPSLVTANIFAEPLYRCGVISVPTPPDRKEGTHGPDPRYSASKLDDVRNCLPEHLFYNFKSHGWVFVNVAQDEALSVPLREIPGKPYPSDVGRALYANCTARPGFSQLVYEDISIHHHFHAYPGATDVPPLLSAAFSSLHEASFQSSAGASGRGGNNANNANTPSTTADLASATIRADLYVCALCQVYVVVSGVIPAIIPRDVLDTLVLSRSSNPPLGKTPQQSVIAALELLVKIMANCLFKGQGGAVNTQATGFLNNLGWNETTAEIFERIGFRSHHELPMRLAPPPFSSASPQGSRNRAIMTRAWIEISAWLHIYKRSPADPGDGVHIYTMSLREEFEGLIGSQTRDQPWMFATNPWHGSLFLQFGMPVESYSEKLLEFAFHQQIRCDPNNIPQYLSALEMIEEIPGLPHRQDLTNFIMTQKSRGLWSRKDLDRAVGLLGFGPDGPLRINFDRDVDGHFLIGAFRNAWDGIDLSNAKEGLYDPEKRDTLRRDLKEALLIASQSLGSQVIVEQARQEIELKSMSPNAAYAAFDATRDVDDDTLIVAYEMRATEQPGEIDKLRTTLQFIAEDRNSDRLRGFLGGGVDSGQGHSHRLEWPRGLYQLGNTCYLNSLLQYFYTIRQLRDALASGSFRSGAGEEDFKGKPIGGRVISSRELDRSRRFVTHLHNLFINLAHAETPAVLPEVELAKLALMTSKDEEMGSGAQETAATSIGSAETDSTLVEANGTEAENPSDIPSLPSHQVSFMSAPSPQVTILGKRSSESRLTAKQEPALPMDVDDSPSPKRRQTTGELGPVSQREATLAEDSEMSDPSANKANPSLASSVPPPLPPRNRQPSVGDMMFGRQNDVSECMDNCIFQIEAALQFDSELGEGSERLNVVKRLFYGTKRQRITPLDEDAKSQSVVSEKTDLFAQLLVNVSNEGTDLYDGLSGFMDDVIEFEGKKASMEVVLVETPPILQIQLQRVQFDRQTMQARKNNAYVAFGETLYMDRFMQSANPEKRAKSAIIQKDLQRCRERVAVLTESSTDPILESLAQSEELAHDFLAGGVEEIDQALVDYLRGEKDVVHREIEDCRARAKQLKVELEELWLDERNQEYELCSVFIHRGTSPAWGHYFFYSCNLPNNPNSWFKYNDSEVSVVSKDEVLADGTGSTANPYLLVYARKGSNVIDTVHRIIPS